MVTPYLGDCFVQTIPSYPPAAELICAVSRMLEPFQGWDSLRRAESLVTPSCTWAE